MAGHSRAIKDLTSTLESHSTHVSQQVWHLQQQMTHAAKGRFKAKAINRAAAFTSQLRERANAKRGRVHVRGRRCTVVEE